MNLRPFDLYQQAFQKRQAVFRFGHEVTSTSSLDANPQVIPCLRKHIFNPGIVHAVLGMRILSAFRMGNMHMAQDAAGFFDFL